MTEEQRKWIDEASIEALLSRLRFAPSGDPIFTGEAGEHFLKTIARRREEAGPAAWTAASKAVGWERGTP